MLVATVSQRCDCAGLTHTNTAAGVQTAASELLLLLRLFVAVEATTANARRVQLIKDPRHWDDQGRLDTFAGSHDHYSSASRQRTWPAAEGILPLLVCIHAICTRASVLFLKEDGQPACTPLHLAAEAPSDSPTSTMPSPHASSICGHDEIQWPAQLLPYAAIYSTGSTQQRSCCRSRDSTIPINSSVHQSYPQLTRLTRPLLQQSDLLQHTHHWTPCIASVAEPAAASVTSTARSTSTSSQSAAHNCSTSDSSSSSSTGSPHEPGKARSMAEVLHSAGVRALGGGLPGAAAMIVQASLGFHHVPTRHWLANISAPVSLLHFWPPSRSRNLPTSRRTCCDASCIQCLM